jgi:hypothetical protein
MIHRIVQTGLLVPYGLICLDFDPLLSPLLPFQPTIYNWKQNERPKDENSIEYIEMKRCKRQLRNQIKREEHEDKLNFYNNLMDKPNSKTFFRLNRKNSN